jgi:hypothetical protein
MLCCPAAGVLVEVHAGKVFDDDDRARSPDQRVKIRLPRGGQFSRAVDTVPMGNAREAGSDHVRINKVGGPSPGRRAADDERSGLV